VALKFACSLCGCKQPRAGCPRCDTRQLTLFDRPPPVPDDAETVTVDEIALAAKKAQEAHAARLARLSALGRPIRIGLVGCAKTKRDAPSPARTLYKSPLFVAALAYAERSCDETFVVSAAHGLLALDETVQPYDRTLRELPKKDRLAWGSRVASAIQACYNSLPLHLVVLAGLEYASPIQAGAFGHAWAFEAPLARKSIGQRLAWLKSQAPVPSAPPQSRRRGAL
jgi:hypothetical protein